MVSPWKGDRPGPCSGRQLAQFISSLASWSPGRQHLGSSCCHFRLLLEKRLASLLLPQFGQSTEDAVLGNLGLTSGTTVGSRGQDVETGILRDHVRQM